MTESVEARPILDAAEAAAASNDYASAEHLLLEAATVQERTLGPAHPDLANTLNNLGVVCERAGKVEEAEACYRRAHAIAITAFPADHRFVATSRQNLEEFCAAHGRSFEIDRPAETGTVEQTGAASEERPAAASIRRLAVGSMEQGPGPTAPSPASEPITQDVSTGTAAPMRLQLDSPPVRDAGPKEQAAAYIAAAGAAATDASERTPIAQRVPDRLPSRALPLGALAVVGISFAIVLVGLIAWPRDSHEPRPPDPTSSASTPVEPPSSIPPAAERSAATAPTVTRAPATVTRTPTPDRGSSPAGGLTVTDARLCRTLSTRGQWDCAPLGNPAVPGPMFFYTKIAAARPTKVQHRWYFGDRLEQSVTLDIQPNSDGFRTFSRRTSNARRAGPWRVELRSQDGQLLREETFTVSK
jgi:hypothetical protein